MDFRNKWLLGTVRILLALLLLSIGGSGLYFVLSGNIPPVEGTTPAIEAAMAGLTVTGIIIFAKIVEIIAGILLITNFRPAFAAVILAPISVGVLLYDLALWMHVPSAIIPAAALFLMNLYLGYAYFPKYRAIFEP
jgi:hypothetical protein